MASSFEKSVKGATKIKVSIAREERKLVVFGCIENC